MLNKSTRLRIDMWRVIVCFLCCWVTGVMAEDLRNRCEDDPGLLSLTETEACYYAHLNYLNRVIDSYLDDTTLSSQARQHMLVQRDNLTAKHEAACQKHVQQSTNNQALVEVKCDVKFAEQRLFFLWQKFIIFAKSHTSQYSKPVFD